MTVTLRDRNHLLFMGEGEKRDGEWLVEQRYRAVLEVLDGSPVSEVAVWYGVSRQSVYSWKARHAAAGIDGLREVSQRPRRPRRWSESCGGHIRGGVPAGSRSRSRSAAWRPRRRGQRCTGSWSATRWSPRRPSSTSASTGGGPGRRRWRCGTWTSWAGSTWPTAGSARCCPGSMIIPGSWWSRRCWRSRPRGRWPRRSPRRCGPTVSRRRC